MISLTNALRSCLVRAHFGVGLVDSRRRLSRTSVSLLFDVRGKDHEKKNQELIVRQSQYFDDVTGDEKNKEAFHAAVDLYLKRNARTRRGHVEFLYAALAKVDEFKAQRDIETYKQLLTILPKYIMKPQNLLQVEFMHYPKQQQCCIDLLDHMEHNGVIPDDEMGHKLVDLFGNRSHVFRKYQRMMYWMPKFKYADPFHVPYDLPDDRIELAKLTLNRMKADLENEITVFQTEDLKSASDKTFVVSAQSPVQRRLLKELQGDETLYVEGPHLTWLRMVSMNHFVLKSHSTTNYDRFIKNLKKFDYKNVDNEEDMTLYTYDRDPRDVATVVQKPSCHEQEDGVVLATCITGTSSKDSLTSWIKFLEASNPSLASTPVLFLLKSPVGEVATTEKEDEDGKKREQEFF